MIEIKFLMLHFEEFKKGIFLFKIAFIINSFSLLKIIHKNATKLF